MATSLGEEKPAWKIDLVSLSACAEGLGKYILKYGDFYKPQKARFVPTFCKRINRTSTAVGNWWQLLKKGRQMTFSATKFIYNNNNKQDFTPNGTNNEYVWVQKRVQGSDRW